MSEAPKRKKIIIRKKGASSSAPVQPPPDKPAPPIEDARAAPEKDVSAQSASPSPMPIPGEETIVMDAPVMEKVVFKFYCVYCGQKLSAKGDMAGKRIRCPTCRHQIEIPVPP